MTWLRDDPTADPAAFITACVLGGLIAGALLALAACAVWGWWAA